jgi:TorA maturation chaperone TorD
MGRSARLEPSAVRLLARLWLHEPAAEDVERAVAELGLPAAASAELALAYAEVFLLNVPPYGTVFIGDHGELNSPEAEWVAQLYEAHGYRPLELDEVAAPDHIGLCLGFLAEAGSAQVADFLPWLRTWAPVTCLAVGHDPAAPPFYRDLAAVTLEALLAQPGPSRRGPRPPGTAGHTLFQWQGEDEVSLGAIVRYFLTPARCGLFLSRARLGALARELGIGLPFGSRFDVARQLFAACGGAGALPSLLGQLRAAIAPWSREYQACARRYPVWQTDAAEWQVRLTDAARLLDQMERVAAEAT